MNFYGKKIAFAVIIVNNYYSNIYYDNHLGEQYPTYVQEHYLFKINENNDCAVSNKSWNKCIASKDSWIAFS